MNLKAPRLAALMAVTTVLRLVFFLPLILTAAATLRTRKHSTPTWTASDRLWDQAHDEIELSVVIPFYNPGNSMRPTVERLVSIMRERGIVGEIIAVSDGSTDGSEKTIEGLAPEVHVIISEQNMGKGAALHRGFAHARGAYIGFVDADGDIDPAHLAEYLHIAKNEKRDVVYASKRMEGAESKSSGLRKIVSLGFSTFVQVLFPISVTDTQTGCKVFSREALANVLPRLREQRFAFDLEFFVAAHAAGVTNMRPAPVAISERLAGSTVTIKSIVRTMLDAFAVFGRLHLTRTYKVAFAGATSHLVPARVEQVAATTRHPHLPHVELPHPHFTSDMFFGNAELKAA